MDDLDFDPRSWGKSTPEKTGIQPVPSPADGAETAAQASASAAPDLPEAWQGIGMRSATPSPAPGATPTRRRAGPALAGVALLLAGAAAVVWYVRPADTETARPAPKRAVAAKPAGGIERSLRLQGSADIAQALATLGISADDAADAARALATILTDTGEIRLTAVLMPKGKTLSLDRVQASYADGSGAVLTRNQTGAFVPVAVAADLTSMIKFVPGEIDTESFYSSAVSAGVPDVLVPEFINAFVYDFNLASEVTPGDTFEVAFSQSVNASGEAVGKLELLYAKLTTADKSLALYRFKQADGTIGWLDGNGAVAKRGFMRTPVDGARITSKFGMRFHPTLRYNRLHGGVDFGAPTGTPIYAAADGVVEFAAAKGCNGNLTVLSHEDGYKTYYLHQNRWMPDIAVGTKVLQGQHIGDVGLTPGGICVTGPHLHYEVHHNGEKIDPLSIPTDTGKRKVLEGAALSAFMQQRNRVDVARAQQGI